MVRSEGSFESLTENNLYPNNILCFSNISGGSISMSNNWWGSTVAASIQSNISGLSGYSNFTPYRLFGPFKLLVPADIKAPAKIPQLLSSVSEETVKLQWNKSTTPDFVRYSIYRSQVPGTTNLTRNNVITNITDVNKTNFFDFPGEGTWYYTVTALDNYNFTNESWYSKVTNVTIVLTTEIAIIKEVDNITLNKVNIKPIPGATISYKIVYSNIGRWPAKNVVIYDKVTSIVSFFSNVPGSATNWIFEYSTNDNPDQSFDSSDYVTGNPVDKLKVKWIRWRKSVVGSDEDGLTLYYNVVIK